MRQLAALLLTLSFAAAAQAPPKENPYVTELRKAIAGKEKLPAGEVFKNVQLLKNLPAGRLLSVMDIGYSQSLGVDCTHCHVEGQWDLDDKRPKKAAREMKKMMDEINAKLADMPHIDNTEPSVNCTTCHRGFVKPALQMK